MVIDGHDFEERERKRRRKNYHYFDTYQKLFGRCVKEMLKIEMIENGKNLRRGTMTRTSMSMAMYQEWPEGDHQ